MSTDTASAGPGSLPAELAARALAAVLHGAALGELPPFAWTLDLPQERLLTLIAEQVPGTLSVIPLSAQRYATLRQKIPKAFTALLAMLLDSRAPGAAPATADRIARIIAAASFGSRHLWQDLGLNGRDEVSLLLAAYFPALHQANTRNLKWKRFLFAELSARQGGAELRPPGCLRCDDFPLCFPESSREGSETANLPGRDGAQDVS